MEFSAISVDEVSSSSLGDRFCVSIACSFFRAVEWPRLSEASVEEIGSAIEAEGLVILES